MPPPDAARTNGYNNYFYTNATPQNRWEATGKVDYAISDNDKVTGSYTYQRESDIAPISIWWSAAWTLPYPSPAVSTTNAYVILTNYTHVFNPTTTNEFVFTWSHFVNPYELSIQPRPPAQPMASMSRALRPHHQPDSGL